MSLINNMLKDLQQRHHLVRQKDITKAMGVKVSRRILSDHLTYLYPLVIVILIVAIMGIGIWQYVGIYHQPIDKPTQLAGYQVSNIQDSTYVQFNFLGKLPTEIKHWQRGSKIYFSLSHTNLDPHFPKTPPINLAVKSIVSVQNKNNLLVALQLLPNTELKYVAVTRKNDVALWLDFVTKAPITSAAIYPEPSLQIAEHKPVLAPAPIIAPAEPAHFVKTTTNAAAVDKQENYQQALDLTNQGNLPAAEKILNNLLAKNPADEQTRQLLAVTLSKQGNLEQASHLLQKGLLQTPDYTPFADLEAHILVQEGKLLQALHVLSANPPDIHRDPAYFAFMAGLQQQTGNSARAIEIYNEVLKVMPDKAVWWMGFGIALESAGHAKDALVAYQHAQELQNLNPALSDYVNQRVQVLGG